MATGSQAEPSKPPRRRLLAPQWLTYASGLLCAWLCTGLGLAMYVLFRHIARAFGAFFFPGSPFLYAAVGLVGGLCAVTIETRRMSRQLELEARLLAFGEGSWKFRLGRGLPMLGIYAVTAAVAAASLCRFIMSSPLDIFLAVGSAFMPCVFLHQPSSRVQERARELLTSAEETGQSSRALPKPMSLRAGTWLNALGVVSMIAVLALSAWMQWGIPFLSWREPHPYVTETQPGGRATQLTYAGEACDPVISPNGRLVAYIRPNIFRSELRLMRLDGSHKRRVGTDSGLVPAGPGPLAWSPDGSHILMVGGRFWNPRSRDYDERPLASLWSIDVANGAGKRLLSDGNLIGVRWLPAGRTVAALTSPLYGKYADLWLVDASGRNPRQVPGLKLVRAPYAVQAWHGGRDLLVAGAQDSAGIWSVDLTTARATRLSELPARWALPYGTNGILFAQRGHVYPPGKSATDIGLLGPARGDVRWVMRDLQGAPVWPALVGRAPVLVFVLCGYGSGGNADLWALNLRNGKLTQLTNGESIIGFDVDRQGTAIVYTSWPRERDRRDFRLFDWNIWRLEPRRAMASW